ncbi:MAG: terpene cyclase/mutase family protein [Eubacteriales bacterium]|nr:terpene cyclase/mutase family protein [Eubacteriales bacterium]
MNFLKRALALLLCMAMLLCTGCASENKSPVGEIEQSAAGLSKMGGKAGTLLKDPNGFPPGTSGCDWTAIALSLAGSRESYSTYLSGLEKVVTEAYAKRGCLDKNKSTEYHRISLTVMALGGDPTKFGKKPDGSNINLIEDGTYNFAADSLGKQGLNGWIWALITLDAGAFEIPADAKFTRASIIEAILSAQEDDGGFGLIKGSSDVDITAMALQALAPYRDEHAKEIENALSFLSGMLNENCGYLSYGAENSETTAQVILALCALGIDPEKDERFIKNNKNLLMQLNRFRRDDGTYSHLLDGEKGDFLATSQSMFAIIAVDRLRKGQEWVFRFSR